MVALPADFMSMRAVSIGKRGLTYMTPFQLEEEWGDIEGPPENYTIVGNEIVFGPYPDKQYSVTLTYQRELTPLSDETPTNWLLEEHQDIYLFAALTHAEFYGWNDARLPMIASQVAEWIEQLNILGNERRYGNQIAPSGPAHIRGIRA